MGEKALVESQVTDALRFLEKLDAEGTRPTLVAWYYYDDVDQWRLLVAGPSFDKLLSSEKEAIAYGKLVEAMASLSSSSLTLSDLKLVSTMSPLPQALRSLIRTGPIGGTRAYFSNTTLNGIFMKEMIILRSV
jgi:hypothetical protein